MRTLKKAISLLTNMAKPITYEAVAIEDAIGRLMPEEEFRTSVNVATVTAGLLNDEEEVEVVRLPVIGLAWFGASEATGDALITALVAHIVAIGGEPAVYPVTAADLPSLLDMAADEELDALVVITGAPEQTIEQIREAKGKILFDGVCAEHLEAVGGCGVKGSPMLILPDDPGQCLAAINTLLKPMVDSFLGVDRKEPIRAELVTTEPVVSKEEIDVLIPAKLSWKNGIAQVRPVRETDLFVAMQFANGWIIMYTDSPSADCHDIVDFLAFGSAL